MLCPKGSPLYVCTGMASLLLPRFMSPSALLVDTDSALLRHELAYILGEEVGCVPAFVAFGFCRIQQQLVRSGGPFFFFLGGVYDPGHSINS